MAYDGSIKIDTKIDTKGVDDGLKKLKSTAVKGAAAVGGAIAAGIGAATKVGADFESSMSQVAATMGMTVEEIQSGSKEYTLLSDAAKKCGEETQFSASQAAEALNYLALAGYDAEKSVNALPTVLNLAAAGGIDLGYASDMVTDSMSALGLETSQLNNFVDQMAKTSQKSNTNVAQLGEAILTVGGTAKMLSGGTVELNTQLGILADNGIKGSEGGTALRNIILALSAPTDKAAGAMKSLGLEAFDAEGKLKPLNEVFLDLNGRLSKLTDKEKTEVLNSIFNKVDLKSVNALLGTSAERFDELSGYISDCDGAAAEMAKTMNDNLKGQITILGSALEGLAIQIYESIDEPMKEAVKYASQSVSELTKSLKSGELSGAIKNVGTLFGTIIKSAVDLANVALHVLIHAIGFLGENIDVIAPTVGVFVGVIKSYELATNAATLAQNLFNASLAVNPIVLATAGIAALSAGIFAYAMRGNEAIEVTDYQSEAYNNLCEKVQSQKQAYDELTASKNAQMYTDLAQIDNVQNLYTELEQLTDSTGKVEEADRSRANFIIEQVNSIIPNALEMVDGQVVKNKELKQSIEDVINTEKAKIILSAQEETYKQAITNVADAQKAQADTAAQLALVQSDLDEVMKEYNDSIEKTGTADINLIGQKNVLQKKVEELTGTLQEQTATYNGYSSAIKQYESDYAAIASGNAEAIQSVINRTKNSYTEEKLALAQSIEEKKNILAQQVIDTETEYALLQEKFQSGEGNITQTQVDEAKTRADDAKEQFKSVGGNLVDGIIVGVDEKSPYLNKCVADLVQRAIEAAKAAGEIHSPSRVMRDEVGAMLAEGVAVGIEENSEKATKQFDKLLGILDKQKDFGIISDEEYYNELKILRDKYLTVGTKEWYEYTKKLLDYQDDYEKEWKKSYEESRDEEFGNLKKKLSYGLIAEGEYYRQLGILRDKYFAEDSDEWQEYSHEIAQYQEKLIENYKSLIEQYASGVNQILDTTKSKLSGTDKLFTTITATYKGVGEHGEDFVITRAKLNDLDEQTEKLREYADTLLAVKQRGELPNGFFDELKDLSVDEGLNFAKALLDANDEEFAEYLQSYKDKEAEISRIANELNADEIDKQKDELMKKLEEMYGEVPEDFFSCGGDSANSFKNGFLDKLPEIFEEIRQAFADGMAAIMPDISIGGGGSSGGNTYTSSYNFYGNGQTVSEQLQAARASSVINRMRGNA